MDQVWLVAALWLLPALVAVLLLGYAAVWLGAFPTTRR